MPEPRGPEGAKCKCGHSMDQHTDSMAAAPCAFWGCRCDDFDQDPAPSPRGPEGATCPTCRGTGADPMSDVTNWYPCQRCNGSGKVDPAPSSPSPAGPGEAELNRLIAGCELAGRDERHSTGKLYLDAAASLRALLARLRESRDAHEQSVLAALVQAGALRAEVARLGAENERLNKVAGENFAVAVEAQERIATARAEEREADCRAVCPTCAHGFPVEFIGSNRVASHRDNDGNLVACAASAIRTREAAP